MKIASFLAAEETLVLYLRKIRRDQTGITSLQSNGNPVASYTTSLDKAQLFNQQFKAVLLINLQATYTRQGL